MLRCLVITLLLLFCLGSCCFRPHNSGQMLSYRQLSQGFPVECLLLHAKIPVLAYVVLSLKERDCWASFSFSLFPCPYLQENDTTLIINQNGQTSPGQETDSRWDFTRQLNCALTLKAASSTHWISRKLIQENKQLVLFQVSKFQTFVRELQRRKKDHIPMSTDPLRSNDSFDWSAGNLLLEL